MKSLIFYTVAIGLVSLLFKVVTAYGEAHLNAPESIGGRYRLTAKNLPQCVKNDGLVLDIQQSGIYVNGSLLTANNTGKSQLKTAEKPSLIGRFNNQNLLLSGVAPHLTGCPNQTVSIQGLVNQQTLKGKMTFSSIATTFNFTGQKETVSSLNKNPEGH